MEAIRAATTAINTIYLLETRAHRRMIESPGKEGVNERGREAGRDTLSIRQQRCTLYQDEAAAIWIAEKGQAWLVIACMI